MRVNRDHIYGYKNESVLSLNPIFLDTRHLKWCHVLKIQQCNTPQIHFPNVHMSKQQVGLEDWNTYLQWLEMFPWLFGKEERWRTSVSNVNYVQVMVMLLTLHNLKPPKTPTAKMHQYDCGHTPKPRRWLLNIQNIQNFILIKQVRSNKELMWLKRL